MSVLRTMFHSKSLVARADHDFLPAPAEAPVLREPRQRRMMAIALALLVVALGFVLYRDRDFWFPDTDEDALQPVPTMPAQTQAKTSTDAATSVAAKSVAVPAPSATKKVAVAKAHVKDPAPGASPLAAAASAPSTPGSVPNATPITPSGAPANAVTTRTILPPLEVEVVAGDNHRTMRPGTNSVHVEMQPGTAPVATNVPTVAAPPAAVTAPAPAVTAGVTTNAAERVQMSAGSAEIVSQPVKPGYPMLARQMRVQGSVILQALIGRDGAIQNLQVLSGPSILANAAQEAVRQWKFKPHYVGNEAVETQAKITVNFTISTN